VESGQYTATKAFQLRVPVSAVFLRISHVKVTTVDVTDAREIDALDQWCLRVLLGIKWYQFVRNDDVRRLTKQPKLTAIIQSRRLTLFGHIIRMDDSADAKRILLVLASRPADWRKQPGRPCITWLSTVQKDLKNTTLRSPKQQIWLNRPLWRMMSTYELWYLRVACQKRRRRCYMTTVMQVLL